jgi:hypothetical protein
VGGEFKGQVVVMIVAVVKLRVGRLYLIVLVALRVISLEIALSNVDKYEVS